MKARKNLWQVAVGTPRPDGSVVDIAADLWILTASRTKWAAVTEARRCDLFHRLKKRHPKLEVIGAEFEGIIDNP